MKHKRLTRTRVLALSLGVAATLPIVAVAGLGLNSVTSLAGAVGGRNFGPTHWISSCTMYLYSTPFSPSWGTDADLDYIRVRKVNQCSSWVANRHAELAIKDARYKIRNAAFHNWVLGFEPYKSRTNDIVDALSRFGAAYFVRAENHSVRVLTPDAIFGYVEYNLRRDCRFNDLEEIRSKFGIHPESPIPTYSGNYTGRALVSDGYRPPEYRWSAIDEKLGKLLQIRRTPEKKCK